jgi:hypothetical protein
LRLVDQSTHIDNSKGYFAFVFSIRQTEKEEGDAYSLFFYQKVETRTTAVDTTIEEG